jgi:hypothetical protein
MRGAQRYCSMPCRQRAQRKRTRDKAKAFTYTANLLKLDERLWLDRESDTVYLAIGQFSDHAKNHIAQLITNPENSQDADTAPLTVNHVDSQESVQP